MSTKTKSFAHCFFNTRIILTSGKITWKNAFVEDKASKNKLFSRINPKKGRLK